MIEFTPYTNDEAKVWIQEYLGASLIKTISRTKFTAKCLVKARDSDDNPIEKEVTISLPSYSKS